MHQLGRRGGGTQATPDAKLRVLGDAVALRRLSSTGDRCASPFKAGLVSSLAPVRDKMPAMLGATHALTALHSKQEACRTRAAMSSVISEIDEGSCLCC